MSIVRYEANTEELRRFVESSVVLSVLKVMPTRMKQITEIDMKRTYKSKGMEHVDAPVGSVVALEYTAPLIKDHWLCEGGAKELWLMSPEEKEDLKMRHPGFPNDDEDGWGTYINKKAVKSIKMDEDFEVVGWGGKILVGKAGDYMIFKPDLSSVWLSSHATYNNDYLEVKE